jgi:hypothetical protein
MRKKKKVWSFNIQYNIDIISINSHKMVRALVKEVGGVSEMGQYKNLLDLIIKTLSLNSSIGTQLKTNEAR